jgi:hypothetical protein
VSFPLSVCVCVRVCVCAGGAVGDAFRVEMIVALRDVRQQLGVARCAQRTLEAQKAAVRARCTCPRVLLGKHTHAHTRAHATPRHPAL